MGLIFSWLRGQRDEPPPLLDVTVETQATLLPEAHLSAPAEFEVQVEDSIAIVTDVPETHVILSEVPAEAEAVVEAEAAVEAEAEPLVQTEPLAEAGEKAVVEAAAEPIVEVEAEATVEVEAEPIVETEVVTKAVVEAEAEPVIEAEAIVEAEAAPVVEAEVTAEETLVEAAVIEAVAVETEDVPALAEAPAEIPVVAAVISEVEAEPVEAPVAEPAPVEVVEVAVADCVADDFVITDSAPVVKAAMAEPELAVVEEQVPAVTADALDALSESLNDITPAPEPVPILAHEVIEEAVCEEERLTKMGERDDSLPPVFQPSDEALLAKEEVEVQLEVEVQKDAIDETTALEALSGDFSAPPQPIISELQCHTLTLVDPVPIPSMEVAEGALNGHVTAEVVIEG
ncbi:calphotin-like isoform X4 [Hypomesus transpacificus]|uniref:calphotin-like isoform X4 n=1 Tax=Hypomesus transpacificus TaxID=137520 RepID=UPI001F07B168|nr:calphotin-like isoform X4 [Hypomesus transpacificus]